MKLSKRVEEDLQQFQHKSEMVVAQVQIIILALLTLLYFLTPDEHAPNAPVNSAGLGLGLFTVLVLVRAWFAYTRQLTPLILGASVITEMAALIVVIWSYHLQFAVSPTIDLRNPHFVYIFVLIALRGLRFEPIWVVLSGLTGALGWIALVGNVRIVAGDAIYTTDYLDYVSTLRVHLGGEINRVMAILLVTLILSSAIYRARKTLSTAVSQSHATKDLSKFFDSSVAEKITESEEDIAAGYGQTRNAAIIFTDMRGFTKYSSLLSPRDLICLLSEYQQLIVPILRAHGGSIDKFLGDGILASFGAVAPSKTYAADVMRAVDEIQLAADDWNKARATRNLPAIEIGAGIATGSVVFGIIGVEDRLEYTVIGDAVNLAAKLEKQNKVEKTRSLTTEASLTLAKSQGYAPDQPKELRKQRIVAGANEAIDVVVLA